MFNLLENLIKIIDFKEENHTFFLYIQWCRQWVNSGAHGEQMSQ